MQMRDARRVAPDGCRRTRLCHCIYESRDRLGPGGQHFSTLILAPLGKDPAVRQPGALGIGRVCPFRGIDVAAKLLKCIGFKPYTWHTQQRTALRRIAESRTLICF